MLSVVIPARNEELRISPTLEAVAEHVAVRGLDAEVIVVDAGSTDRTVEIAAAFTGVIPRLRIVPCRPTRRCNKGDAVRTGMLAASGDLRCFIDADNAAPFGQIDLLMEHADEADVVIGSRYIAGGDAGERAFWRRLISRGGNLLFRGLLGLPFADTRCPLKLFTARAAELLFGLSRIDGFGFDTEVLATARRHGLRIVEVPVAWHAVEGSSVHATTVFASLGEIASIRFNLARGAYDAV